MSTVMYGAYIYSSGQPYTYVRNYGVSMVSSLAGKLPCSRSDINGVYIQFWPTLHVYFNLYYDMHVLYPEKKRAYTLSVWIRKGCCVVLQRSVDVETHTQRPNWKMEMERRFSMGMLLRKCCVLQRSVVAETHTTSQLEGWNRRGFSVGIRWLGGRSLHITKGCCIVSYSVHACTHARTHCHPCWG